MPHIDDLEFGKFDDSGAVRTVSSTGGGETAVTSVSTRITNGSSAVIPFGQNIAAFVSKLIATTAAGATIKLYGTNTNSLDGGVLLATFTNTLAALGTHEDGAVINGSYAFIFAIVSDVSGTITSLDLEYSI